MHWSAETDDVRREPPGVVGARLLGELTGVDGIGPGTLLADLDVDSMDVLAWFFELEDLYGVAFDVIVDEELVGRDVAELTVAAVCSLFAKRPGR